MLRPRRRTRGAPLTQTVALPPVTNGRARQRAASQRRRRAGRGGRHFICRPRRTVFYLPSGLGLVSRWPFDVDSTARIRPDDLTLKFSGAPAQLAEPTVHWSPWAAGIFFYI